MADTNTVIKELQTRIALKYDTYANWTNDSVENQGANLILLAGEIGLCEIENKNQGAQTAPTVLFKVGNGKDPFKSLQWASAKAADVYDWAKATDVALSADGKTINFVGTNKSLTLGFITEAEVKSKITNDLTTRISNIETSIADGGAVDGRFDAIEGDIATIKGTGAGSISKAVADAVIDVKAYADTAEADALEAAKGYVDGKISTVNETIGGLNTTVGGHTTQIAGINTTVSEMDAAYKAADAALKTAYEAADTAINAKIGTGFDSTNTVKKAIEDAITSAATTAQEKVNALKNAEVAANTSKIGEHTTAIANLQTAVGTETAAREEADEAIIERLEEVEAFFKLKDDETLDTALDTLKEIQDYLNGEGNATDGIIGRVAANEKAIENLGKADETINGRIDTTNTNVSGLATKVEALEGATAGYSAAQPISAAISAVNNLVQNAQKAADDAQDAADAAQDAADAVKTAVNDGTTGLAATKAIADKNKTDLAALTTRVGTAETNITSLQDIVTKGDNTNSKLRSDITDLQGIVKTGADANATLRSDLTTLAGRVTTAEGTLATTTTTANEAKTQANTNKTDIATIKGDYLRAVDCYIFNCGSATTAIYPEATV